MASSNSPDSIDYFAIKNALARYCIALDTKDFTLFKEVFTDDVYAKYPFGEMRGVQEMAKTIENRLKHITSQHALTTQVIEVSSTGESAKATTYFTAAHFGKGKWEGQQYTAWGKYIDSLVMSQGGKSLPGARGRWLIENREVEFMGRGGEQGIMAGE